VQVFSPGVVLFIANDYRKFVDVLVNTLAGMRIDLVLSGSMTKFLGLLPGSPANDQMPLDACHIYGTSTDHRGVKRPDGNEITCDKGALESSN
jgi:hypothetical protein